METGKLQVGAGISGREAVQCPPPLPDHDAADCDLDTQSSMWEQEGMEVQSP